MNPGDVVYQVIGEGSYMELRTGVVVVSPKGKMAILYDQNPDRSEAYGPGPFVSTSIEDWSADKEELLHNLVRPIRKEFDRRIDMLNKLVLGEMPVSTFDARIVPDVVTGG